MLNNVFSPFIIASVFGIAIFYFLSAFLGMYALLKIFHQPIFKAALEKNVKRSNIPHFNSGTVIMLILKRYWRLAIPAYFVLSLIIFLPPFMGSGPLYLPSIEYNFSFGIIKD